MALEVLPPRRASLSKKYIEELRVDTTGFLAGACMKEIKRDEGLYYVQVADHPVPDIEGLFDRGFAYDVCTLNQRCMHHN